MHVGNVKILTVAENLDLMLITDFDSVPAFARSRIWYRSHEDPYQHGMSHPQVADGGMAFSKEGNCEYTGPAKKMYTHFHERKLYVV